jgi:hypothetical protein
MQLASLLADGALLAMMCAPPPRPHRPLALPRPDPPADPASVVDAPRPHLARRYTSSALLAKDACRSRLLEQLRPLASWSRGPSAVSEPTRRLPRFTRLA